MQSGMAVTITEGRNKGRIGILRRARGRTETCTVVSGSQHLTVPIRNVRPINESDRTMKPETFGYLEVTNPEKPDVLHLKLTFIDENALAETDWSLYKRGYDVKRSKGCKLYYSRDEALPDIEAFLGVPTIPRH